MLATAMRVCRQRYRLTTPTLAIIHEDGHNSPVTVPNGAVVKMIAGTLDGNRLIDVMWDGKALMMFTTDIRARCVPLEDV